MYNGLVHAHSGLRWVLLILLITAVYKGINGWLGKKDFTEGDRKVALFAMIFTHIQLLLGGALYFMSPKVTFAEGFMQDSVSRFYSIEHLSLMLVAIVLITVGFSTAKRIEDSTAKFKKIAIFYGIALLLILAAIPWPFRGLGAGWA